MTDLDALLAGIVANPHEPLRWLIVADWLDDHGQPERAELLRLHRMLIDTCCEPDAHPDRAAWQARIVELIDQGVTPCVPRRTLALPGGVPLVGNFIPPGSFLMGSEDESPVHKVTISQGFFMGTYPVTQAQWRAVMGTDPTFHLFQTSPSSFKGDTLPVSWVNWDELTAFCEGLTGSVGFRVRLPTEAEWEYACRAGTTTHFHWGDVPSAERMNYDARAVWNGSLKGNARREPVAVGTFAANPWGIVGCHGNVWERCADLYDEEFYSRSPTVDPLCESVAEPLSRPLVGVLRGGARGVEPDRCRAATRYWWFHEARDKDGGFRVVFTLT